MSADDEFEKAWFRPDAPQDPMHAAQKGLKPEMPKRFWREASAIERDGLFVLALDGRLAKTPARRALGARTQGLADAIADEWNAQGDRLDPSTMPLTRLMNSAIDGVADSIDAVADEIRRYAATDMLCYRAPEPASLVARQKAAWDPVLDWAAQTLGARLHLAEGIIHQQQDAEALDAIARAIRTDDAARLTAVHVMTTLTGSALLALAVERGRLEAEAAWNAAHVDEDHQIELWGADEEAAARRAWRWREMEAAARVLVLG